MVKKSVIVLVSATMLASVCASAQTPPSATAEIRELLNQYRHSALTNSRHGMADWIRNNVLSNFMGVTTTTMSTFDKNYWYEEVAAPTNERCTGLTFIINSVSAQKGVAVVRMNVDYRGSRMSNGKRRTYRFYGSYRDTWRWVNGRWFLDTDEERSYKEWVGGKYSASDSKPSK